MQETNLTQPPQSISALSSQEPLPRPPASPIPLEHCLHTNVGSFFLQNETQTP